MQHDANSIAAAELADHYISLILSTNPELLVGRYVGRESPGDGQPEQLKLDAISDRARSLTEFRQQLVNQLLAQPLPPTEG